MWDLGSVPTTELRALAPFGRVTNGDVRWNRWLLLPESKGELAALVLASLAAIVLGCILASRRRVALVLFFVGTSGYLLFFGLIFPGMAHHHGYLFAVWILGAWLAWGGAPSRWPPALQRLSERFEPERSRILTLSLVLPVLATVEFAGGDLVGPFSDARHVADIIRSRGLANAPIVVLLRAEGQPVAAFLDRPVIFPLEQKERTFVVWGGASPYRRMMQATDSAVTQLLIRECRGRGGLVAGEGCLELSSRRERRRSTPPSATPMSDDRYRVWVAQGPAIAALPGARRLREGVRAVRGRPRVLSLTRPHLFPEADPKSLCRSHLLLLLRLLHVVGARPNFPEARARVQRAGRRVGVEQIVVHTGQHYDALMSSSFFDDLGIPPPDPTSRSARGRTRCRRRASWSASSPCWLEHRPDWLVVYGDVNSTMAAALVAAKLGVRIAHVEAGLRSGDRAMPEEINRIVTDRLADLLLTPSRDADETLRREGARAEQIVFVGNVMIDSLLHALPRAGGRPVPRTALGADRLARAGDAAPPVERRRRRRAFAPSSTRSATIGRTRRVLFPSHPRTRAAHRDGSGCRSTGVELIAPLAYHDMVDVMARAHAVVTDSGGIQEETTALGVPCFTVRDNTERPITITEGTNQLVRDLATLPALVERVRRPANPPRPEGMGWMRRRADHPGTDPDVSGDGAMEYPRGATRG